MLHHRTTDPKIRAEHIADQMAKDDGLMATDLLETQSQVLWEMHCGLPEGSCLERITSAKNRRRK